MGYLEIRDDSIWVRHIDGDKSLRDRLAALRPDDTIELDVGGIVGSWQKMKTGKDGRPTSGLKPVGPMREVWKRMQARRGEIVPIRVVATVQTYLAALTPLMNEWESPEDDEAYRDL